MEHMKRDANYINQIKHKPEERGFELLAPAGSFEIFKAVIAAGADAVYVGGDMFGARAYANNFSREELLEAIDYAHLRGVKVYLTVNTLLKNEELSNGLYEYLLPFYEQGLDAVLVQDMGVLSFVRRSFPKLSIHTSTQMTITGSQGAGLMQDLGVERVVMAREVSLSEMKRIHDETGVELEAFVHGALCYCYSGQCLLSSMLGGRSGNRGRCAQPCRLAYSVLDESKKAYQKESYVLSLKDMCGIDDLERLWEAGVYSLKIEGRMKQASYAAGVVSFYRKYIDLFLAGKKHERVNDNDMQMIMDLGNRCGFTDAYYSRQNGRDMVTFVKPSYAKTNEALQKQMIERYVEQEKKLVAEGTLWLSVGKPAVYEVKASGNTVRVEGMEVMPAQRKPLERQDVRARMEKTGDTAFVMKSVTVEMEEQVFLPIGALNQLRRDALTQLTEAMLTPYRRELLDEREKESDEKNIASKKLNSKTRYSCLIENRQILSLVLQKGWVNRVYLDWSMYRLSGWWEKLRQDVSQIKESGKEAYLALPRVFRTRISDWFEQNMQAFKTVELDGALIRTYEELSFVKRLDKPLDMVIDHNMYTYNDRSVEAFQKLGVSENTVPLELNRKEIFHRDNTESSMIVYGYYPLMTTAPCVHANTKGCDQKPGLCFLKDRYHALFPVKNYCDACYNVVYNSLPVMLFANMDELKKAGIQEFRADFTVENPNEAEEILTLMESFVVGSICEYPAKMKEHYTNGHYKRGVE